MGRKKIGFKKEEISFVRSYIEKKLITKNWPSHDTQQEALTDYKQRPIVGRYAHDELTRWCKKWLNDTQWQQLKNTMNSWRYRQNATEPPKKIQLSPDAWKIISSLAQMEKKTISSLIIDRFKAEYHTQIGNSKMPG